MSQDANHYSTQGILPEADQVVVAAAYRALAQRYHPDKWAGDPSVAHERMARINQAYETLRDPDSRAKYDQDLRSRESSAKDDEHSFGPEEPKGVTDEIQERWLGACKIYPDLADISRELAKIADTLSSSYVTTLLHSKNFERRRELAQSMELEFLARYFGRNPQIIEFARRLILAKRKDAAKRLNAIIDVVGDSVSPDNVIAQVKSEAASLDINEQVASIDELISRGDEKSLIEVLDWLGYSANRQTTTQGSRKWEIWDPERRSVSYAYSIDDLRRIANRVNSQARAASASKRPPV